MTERRVTDGVRIAQLLSSEVHGRTDGVLAHVAVANADRDVEATLDGARAYDVVFGSDPLVSVPDRDVDVLDVDADGDVNEADRDVLASVFVQPERVRIEFRTGVAIAADAASGTRLRVRPKATEPPRTLVFVESGAAVKDAADVVEAVVEAILDDERDNDT